MRTLKLFWCACLAFCVGACSESQSLNDNAVEKYQHEFIYQGHKYSMSYEIVDSVIIYDESDSAACLYFRLQENSNLAVLVEEGVPALLFDDSEALIAYISLKEANKVGVKASYRPAIKASTDDTQEFIIYADANYGGYYKQFLIRPGVVTNDYIISSNMTQDNQYPNISPNFLSFNDAMSSFRSRTIIKDISGSNYTHIVLYEHANFGGKSITFPWETSVPDLHSYTMTSSWFSSESWNDNVSSIKLIRQ